MKDIAEYNLTTAQVLKSFTKAYDKSLDDNQEEVTVGLFIITNMSWAMGRFNSGDDIRKFVIEFAEDDGHFAGLEYVAEAMLDPDDDAFEHTDGGLGWVPFDDLYNLLLSTLEFAKVYDTLRSYQQAVQKMLKYVLEDVQLFRATELVNSVEWNIFDEFSETKIDYIRAAADLLFDMLNEYGQVTAKSLVYDVLDYVRKLTGKGI